MNLFEAIILGIIQGVTEFLPISSTGHLTLAGQFMNLISVDHPERWTSFIAVIQLGTLISILIYFRTEIIEITASFLKENISHRVKYQDQSSNSKLAWLIFLGTLPIVIIGLLFKDEIEGVLTKNLYVIAFSLIALAIILAIAEKISKQNKKIENTGVMEAIIIGLAQAMALIPGSSRSGTTITGGLLVGLNRESAARFSFLLSIPAVFASGLLQFIESLEYLDASAFLNLTAATLASAISGYLAIDFLLKYLKKHSTFIFIYYRIIIGVLILILLSMNIIQPQ